MIRHDADFVLTVHAALAATPIVDRLGTTGAVILERVAKGGGATRWYYCPDNSHLGAVEERLSPGSTVSFYFDGRIRSALYSHEVKSNIERIIIDESEAVIGRLRDDGLQIQVEIVSNLDEIDDFGSTINPTARVFYGAFPATDNDGIGAVTVVLPAPTES
jgi:hypothetical protein